MNEEEKQELWRMLWRLDRKLSVIGAVAILAATGAFGLLAYWNLPTVWGINKEIAGWVAFVIGCGVSFYLLRKFEKG